MHFKNRQGLEIGTMPAVYSNDKGYFEVPNVRSNDYRLEVTHTFETAKGHVALRLFTNTDLIQVDTTDYSMMIGLSRLTADRAHEKIERDRAFTSSLEERNGKYVPALPDSSLKKFWHWNAENFLFGSRIVVEHRRDLRFMENAHLMGDLSEAGRNW